jgi:hypothetical protein
VKLPLRLMFATVIATLIVAGFCAAEWSGSTDLDFWNVPTLQADIAGERLVAKELEASDEEVSQRIVVKDAVVADLSAGHIGLMAAAAKFRALNAGSDSFAVVVGSMYPDMSDDERVCRNVIDYAESANATCRLLGFRLRLELLARKATGRLRIPDLPSNAEGESANRAAAGMAARGG